MTIENGSMRNFLCRYFCLQSAIQNTFIVVSLEPVLKLKIILKTICYTSLPKKKFYFFFDPVG